MNKVLKGFLIAAGICVVSGIAILAGIAASGSADEVRNAMENGGVYWADSGLQIGTTIILKNDADTEITIADGKEYTYPADEIKNIEMELGAGRFDIVEADVDQIIIRSAKSIKVSNSGNTISIETPDRFKVFGFSLGNEHMVEITLPKGQKFNTIDLEAGAAELEAEALLADTISIEIGAGTMDIESFQCREADISVGAGEVIVEEGTAEDMSLDVGMGNYQFTGSITGDLDADCGMGNMDIKLSGEEEEHNYMIDCGMGDVSVGGSSYGGIVSDRVIDNDAASEFDLDCGMGNITISFSR